MAVILLFIIIFSLVFQAKYDAVNGNLHDFKSKLFLITKALTISAIGIFYFENMYTILGYVFLRAGIFDLLFSYFRYGIFSYIGTTSKWDNFIITINPTLIWSLRFLCSITGIYLILNI